MDFAIWLAVVNDIDFKNKTKTAPPAGSPLSHMLSGQYFFMKSMCNVMCMSESKSESEHFFSYFFFAVFQFHSTINLFRRCVYCTTINFTVRESK